MIGDLVYDYALGKKGIVVGEAWTERNPGSQPRKHDWEWLVLYEDGELQGADTGDLQDVR